MRKRVVILLVCMCVTMAMGSCGSNLSEVSFEEENVLSTDEADSVTKRHESTSFGIDQKKMVDVLIRIVCYAPGGGDNPIATNEYEYDDEGNNVRQTVYNQEGDRCKWFEYEYDGDGKKVEEMMYDKEMDSSYWREYEYDGRGRATGWVQYDDLNESICQWCEYEYDDAGNKVKEVIYDSEGEILLLYEFGYNDAGKIVKELIININKEAIYFWGEWEYDEKGDVIKRMLEFDPDSKKMIRQREYEHNEAGNVVKVTTYDNEENIIDWQEFEYGKVKRKR